MLKFLSAWLVKHGGEAPVVVTLVGENKGGTQYLMRGLDAVGVVLTPASVPNRAAAFPWSAIVSISPTANVARKAASSD